MSPAPLRVVALCDDLDKALRLWRRLEGVEGANLSLLVTNNSGRSRTRWMASMAAQVARSGPGGARTAIGCMRRGRLRMSPRRLHDPAVVERLRREAPDVGLHAAGAIYRRELIDCFRLGLLNPHIGLLPRYRGRSVMEWSILEGAPTGITTFFIDEGIDTGPEIVLRKEIDVSGRGGVADAKGYLFGLDGDMFAEALEVLRRDDFEPAIQRPEDGVRFYAMSRLLTGVVEQYLEAV